MLEDILDFIDSMLARIKAVIAANGSHTKW